MKKKILTALLAILMAVPVCAQEYDRTINGYNVYYGVRLGLALATVNSDDAKLDGGSMQAGLNVGAVIGFQLSTDYPIFLESGLMYTEKGGKGYNEQTNKVRKKFTFDLNYLEVPILLKYSYELDDDLYIQPFGGGYLAMGISGKMKDYSERVAESSFSDTYFKRFDGGLKIGCGIQYQIVYADISYDFGLRNINHSEFDSSHNGCFYITAGVNF